MIKIYTKLILGLLITANCTFANSSIAKLSTKPTYSNWSANLFNRNFAAQNSAIPSIFFTPNITGPDYLCFNTPGVYEVFNLPSGAVITGWATTDACAQVDSSSGTQVTVSRVGAGGQFQLEVSYTVNSIPYTQLSNTISCELNYWVTDAIVGDLFSNCYYGQTMSYELNALPTDPSIVLNIVIISSTTYTGVYSNSHAITGLTGTIPMPNLPVGQYDFEIWVSGGPCGDYTGPIGYPISYTTCE